MGALSHRRWRDLRAEILATHPPICTHPDCRAPTRRIDMTLSGMDPLGPTVDHIRARSKGGSTFDPHNCALMHRVCNLSKGNRPPKRKRPRSRDW